jgi:hypothetical protein
MAVIPLGNGVFQVDVLFGCGHSRSKIVNDPLVLRVRGACTFCHKTKCAIGFRAWVKNKWWKLTRKRRLQYLEGVEAVLREHEEGGVVYLSVYKKE